LAVVVDHYSRRALGIAVFGKQPTQHKSGSFLAESCPAGVLRRNTWSPTKARSFLAPASDASAAVTAFASGAEARADSSPLGIRANSTSRFSMPPSPAPLRMGQHDKN
jgi:hypothetical protein